MFVIKDIIGNLIEEYTLSNSQEEAWDKHIGFSATDDQWSWQKQKAEQCGYFAVEVALIEKPNKEIYEYIKLNMKEGVL